MSEAAHYAQFDREPITGEPDVFTPAPGLVVDTQVGIDYALPF